jgi:hypothetical protein
MSHDQNFKNLMLDFHYISVGPARMPYRQHRDSCNIVARANLPNMAHARRERVQVFADAIRGLFRMELSRNGVVRFSRT